MQSVIQVNVGMPGGPKDHRCARRNASRRMARQIVPAKVCFRFGNPSGGVAVDKQLPQQATRHLDGRLGVKLPWENGIHSLFIMRLFTAVDLQEETIRALAALVAQLKPVARLRWSPAENLHITTKFIGEWPPERLPELQRCLPAFEPAPSISVFSLGFFPNERFPKVLYARVEPTQSLLALAKATDQALTGIGIPAEKHPYRPHVTLARIPEAVYLHPLKDRLAELNPGRLGQFEATGYSLYESRARHYIPVETYPFRGAAA